MAIDLQKLREGGAVLEAYSQFGKNLKQCTKPPHKLPEPLHLAHRIADKLREKMADESERKN